MDKLLWVQVIKAIVEMALMLLAARGVLRVFFMFSPAAADGNFVYRLCKAGTEPLVRLVRRVTPSLVMDRHLPLAAFGLLLACWLGLSLAKIELCAAEPGRPACEALARLHSAPR